MTIESDSGYSPMALAVALGHKKSMYCLIPDKQFLFIRDYCKKICYSELTLEFVLFPSSESIGGPYSETLQANTNMTLVNINKWTGQSDTVDLRSTSTYHWWSDA